MINQDGVKYIRILENLKDDEVSPLINSKDRPGIIIFTTNVNDSICKELIRSNIVVYNNIPEARIDSILERLCNCN